MKKHWIVLVIMMVLSLSACSNGGSDSSTAAAAPESTSTTADTIDYQNYTDLNVDNYDDFEQLPADLKDDVYRKAMILVKFLDKLNQYNAADASLYSSLNSAACLLYHCWKPMVECVLDKESRAQLMSLGDCVFMGGDEMMICFIETFAQPKEKLLAMLSCLGDSGCMPVPVPNCPLPTNRNQIARVTLADLEGDWYVVRGLSKVYDCWSGQKYTFRRVSENVSTYDYTYFPTDKNTPVSIECTTTAIPFSPSETTICPGRFRVDYTAYGMPGADNWFVLSHPNANYVLIYYCGASAMDSYTGAIVLSRSLDTTIPQSVLNSFAAALANAGISDPISLADLCTPDNSGITYADLTVNALDAALMTMY